MTLFYNFIPLENLFKMPPKNVSTKILTEIKLKYFHCSILKEYESETLELVHGS